MPDWGNRDVPHSLGTNTGIVPRLGHDRFLSSLFFFFSSLPDIPKSEDMQSRWITNIRTRSARIRAHVCVENSGVDVEFESIVCASDKRDVRPWHFYVDNRIRESEVLPLFIWLLYERLCLNTTLYTPASLPVSEVGSGMILRLKISKTTQNQSEIPSFFFHYFCRASLLNWTLPPVPIAPPPPPPFAQPRHLSAKLAINKISVYSPVILRWPLNVNCALNLITNWGLAMKWYVRPFRAQAVRCRLHTAAARFRFQVVTWNFWWRKWHWGRFSPSTSVPLVTSLRTNYSSLVCGHPGLVQWAQ
jgi:hypothetical protein